jgi:hypothetical protein
MFVRVRAPRYTDHRAAVVDCLPQLAGFAASALVLAGVTSAVRLHPLFAEPLHTRVPGLVAAAVIALTAQAVAIGVRYVDHLRRQRRRATAAALDRCGCDAGVPLVFDLPKR